MKGYLPVGRVERELHLSRGCAGHGEAEALAVERGAQRARSAQQRRRQTHHAPDMPRAPIVGELTVALKVHRSQPPEGMSIVLQKIKRTTNLQMTTTMRGALLWNLSLGSVAQIKNETVDDVIKLDRTHKRERVKNNKMTWLKS